MSVVGAKISRVSALYVEYPVPEPLRSFVDCFWSSGDGRASPGAKYPIVPDGCVDIVFRFAKRPGAIAFLEELTVVGPMTRPLWLTPHAAEEWLGVRFLPGRAFPFVGIPLSRLVDLRPDAADVLEGAIGGRLQGIGRLGSMEERLEGLERIILSSGGSAQAPPESVTGAVNLIQETDGDYRVDLLSSEIGISRQHLSREFAKHVGLSPKKLSRIVRFRRALRRVRQSVAPDWADLAAGLGYYDQAHFIAEFTQFAGLSPGRYRRCTDPAHFATLPKRPASVLQWPQFDSLEAGMRR